MLCAECPRCRRRSIIGLNKERLPPEEADATPPRLRCDLCGSRAVRVLRFRTPIEALRFANARG